ncbi:hypothetical protein D5266_09295, partial [bacterium c-19]|nr:hypothetical protein [bacterium c-19]
MKRKIITGICALFLFVVSFPVVKHIAGSVNAAGTLVEPSGEKVIDFAINAYSGIEPSDIFVITGSRQLYQCKINAQTCAVVESDSEGNPINNVKKISLYRGKNSYKELKLLFLLDKDKVYLKEGVDGSPVLLNTSGISNIVDIASDEKNQYIVTANGDVYARGDNSAGQLCDNNLQSSDTFVKINIDNVKKISAGDKNVIALKNDGTIYAWGIAIYDGLTVHNNVSEPVPLNIDGKLIQNAIDISEYIDGNTGTGLSIMVKENNELKGYLYQTNSVQLMVSKNDFNKNIDGVFYRYEYNFQNNFGYLSDGDAYTEIYTDGIFKWLFEYRGQDNNFGKIKKIDVAPTSPGWDDFYFITETGAFYRFVSTTNYNTYEIKVGDALKVKGFKSDDIVYASAEKYNDDVDIETSTSETLTITCKVQDPVGSAETNCTDFQNNEIHVSLQNDRIYRKYLFTDTEANKEFIVDLYKGAPKLGNYLTSGVNKIKVTDSISLDVPTDQSSWNSYTATVTDSSNQTKDFTGGTLAEGTYTMYVTDAYGNTQDYQFEVSDKPTPTANFNPANTSLTYGDNATKVNNTIGTFTLQYPAGKPTSNIKTIQLGTAGDEDHFSIDTSGNLKVKGNDLDAGTYSVTVSGTDGNDMAFTKTVSITVDKKDQNNYQITNSANYPLQVNQEIAITTSGNESGGSETYSITSGNTVAQISNGNKFKILDSGTFTLEATVAGNTNYNSKTVTKQITISQLPTQNPPVSITSKDSMMYGDTYTPSYSGGQGSGAISWKIESDNGTGAVLNNGSVKVTGIGSFTLKVTKAGTSSYQESSATKVITVNKRKTTVKPKDVTKVVGEAFKPSGATYHPQPVNGDNLGTLTITSKYPDNQVPGRYTDGIQASGLS